MILVMVVKEAAFKEPANKRVGNNATINFSKKRIICSVSLLGMEVKRAIKFIIITNIMNNPNNKTIKKSPTDANSRKSICKISNKTDSLEILKIKTSMTFFKINRKSAIKTSVKSIWTSERFIRRLFNFIAMSLLSLHNSIRHLSLNSLFIDKLRLKRRNN